MSESRRSSLIKEALQFLTVGGVSYIVDVGLSNLLVYGLWAVPVLLHDGPIKAKIISTIASVIVAWMGNKLWTYGDRETGSNLRGFVLFVLVNGAGMIITVLPLAFTWYVLGLRGPIAYNISTNIVGIALAMAFRFYAYRTWVFRDTREVVEESAP